MQMQEQQIAQPDSIQHSLIQFAQDYPGVVLLLVAVLFSITAYLLKKDKP